MAIKLDSAQISGALQGEVKSVSELVTNALMVSGNNTSISISRGPVLGPIIYTSSKYGFVVNDTKTEDNTESNFGLIITEVDDMDSKMAEKISLPREVMYSLVEVSPESETLAYDLAYLINRAFRSYNLTLETNTDSYPAAGKAPHVEMDGLDFEAKVKAILERYSNREEEVMMLFEALKDFEIVSLFSNYDIEDILSLIAEVIEKNYVPSFNDLDFSEKITYISASEDDEVKDDITDDKLDTILAAILKK